MSLIISPANHVSMVITQSDSLKTATAANVFEYAIASEQKQKTTLDRDWETISDTLS